MATSITGRVTINAALDFINTLDVGKAEYNMKSGKNYTFTNGTGADQANQLFTDTRTLAPVTGEDLDLAGGLTDTFGNTVTFTKIKALIVTADPGNTNTVQLGNQAVNGIDSILGASSHWVKIRPGGTVVFVAPDSAGYAITAGTADLLRFANGGSGTNVTYTVIILGTV